MDPLSALAIAAAIFQFLELGGKLYIRAWKKYQGTRRRRRRRDAQSFAEEEKALRETLDDLSFQISWFRQVSTSIMVSQPPTQTQIQLLKLSSQCNDLVNDFEQTERRMEQPNSGETISEIHLREHVSFGRHVREDNCRKCRKWMDNEIAKVQGNQKDIESIEEKLKLLKRHTIDLIIISLWDESKRTKKWELHFSNQLETVIELLGNAEELVMTTRPGSALSNQKIPTQDQSSNLGSPKSCIQESGIFVSTATDEELAGLRNVLQPLIQPGDGPLSLKQLAEDIIKTLSVGFAAEDAIRMDLFELIWSKDWKLATSMALPKIDTTMVAHAIATGVQFTNIQTREEAISKNFENTYSWIFLDETMNKDDMPMWDSFPKWLENDSQKVYWITGKPGSGKSTIMKLILQEATLKDRLSQSLGSLQLLIVRYYAWISGNTLQKSIEGLKRTILFQALEQFPDLAPVLTPRRWAFCQALRSTSRLPIWDTWEVEESFEALLSSCGETIKLTLFIDGLDEFEIPPFDVIKCIQYMRTRCPDGLKVCVASRPWPEFQDEFNEGPMLQMHLLTENDMKIFVNENFKINKGFVEQRELRPEAASQLLTDIVQRANGVFLWVSIVVQHLSSCFSEGQSIFQARETLEALPTSISSLYDAIWAGIDPNNLPDASYMIQVLRASNGPIPWLALWLIEESRFTAIDKIVCPETENKIIAAQRSLKRKLAARTKCILEINEGGKSSHVDFIHRTARDWAVQPKMWQLICSKFSRQFDPYLDILRGKTVALLQYPLETRHYLNLIIEILQCASQVKDIQENTAELVNCLNLVNEHFESILKACRDSNYGDIQSFILNYGNNFLEASAHFAILPYIKAVACSQPSYLSQMFSGGSLRLLRAAIYTDPTDTETYILQDACGQRLATVKYLLDQDVFSWRAHIWNRGFSTLKRDIRSYSKRYPANSEYFSTVTFYLNEKESELGVASQIWSFFMKVIK